MLRLVFLAAWSLPPLLQQGQRLCRALGPVFLVISTYLNLAVSRDREDMPAGLEEEQANPRQNGPGMGTWYLRWTGRMTSLLMFAEGTLLSQLTGLGMNSLHTPVFTQYIRSKWKVCAAAKSRKWWLGITFGGKDALKQTLAPSELWMGRKPSTRASQDIWSTRPTQCRPFQATLKAGGCLACFRHLGCYSDPCLLFLVKRNVVYKWRLNKK